jgi:hypothetical protein
MNVFGSNFNGITVSPLFLSSKVHHIKLLNMRDKFFIAERIYLDRIPHRAFNLVNAYLHPVIHMVENICFETKSTINLNNSKYGVCFEDNSYLIVTKIEDHVKIDGWNISRS